MTNHQVCTQETAVLISFPAIGLVEQSKTIRTAERLLWFTFLRRSEFPSVSMRFPYPQKQHEKNKWILDVQCLSIPSILEFRSWENLVYLNSGTDKKDTHNHRSGWIWRLVWAMPVRHRATIDNGSKTIEPRKCSIKLEYLNSTNKSVVPLVP